MSIETFEHKGVQIALHYDEHPSSPREWDNLGTMLCNYRGYDLGDGRIEPGEHENLEALLDWIRETYGATVILPLYILDHSGLTMSAGPAIEGGFREERNHFISDPGGWDTSMVGFIFDTPEALEAFGAYRPASIEEALRAEVEDYDRYLRGELYGYVVGDYEESCWGFWDLDEARTEAVAVAEQVALKREKQRRIDALKIDLSPQAIREMFEEHPISNLDDERLISMGEAVLDSDIWGEIRDQLLELAGDAV